MRSPVSLSLALVLASLLETGCATTTRTVVVGPQFEEGDVEILEEEAALRCEGEGEGEGGGGGSTQRCVLEARYELRARTPAPMAQVLSHGVESIELRGEDGALEPVAKGRGGPSEAPPGVPREHTQPELWSVDQHRLELGEVGALRRVQLRAVFEPPPVRWARLVHTAALGRHVAMSELFHIEACVYDTRGCQFWVSYAPASPSASAGDLRVEAQDADVEVSEDGTSAQIVVHGGQRRFAPGGPFVGFGVGFDAATGRADRAKFRAGWEVFAPSEVAHALAIEVDGQRRVTFAVTCELMSPVILVLPSVGIGVGVPVQIAPTARVGVRGQLSVQVPYLGLLATVDLFPGDLLARELEVNPSLYLQFVF